MNLFPQYVKVWNYLEEKDMDRYFKTQLPKRMWWVVMSGLKSCINDTSDFNRFVDLFRMIRSTPIIQNKILKTDFIEPLAPTYRIFHFLFRMKWARLYFFLVKHDVFHKFKNLLKN